MKKSTNMLLFLGIIFLTIFIAGLFIMRVEIVNEKYKNILFIITISAFILFVINAAILGVVQHKQENRNQYFKK